MAFLQAFHGISFDLRDVNWNYFVAHDADLAFTNSSISFQGVTYGGRVRLTVPGDSRVEFYGQGLQVNSAGQMTGGTVQAYSELNFSGGTFSRDLIVTGLSISATTIAAAMNTASNSDDLAVLQTAFAGNDTFDLSSGNDYVNAYAGNDIIYGGQGKDTLYGGDGDDTIYGNHHDDALYGGNGNDTLSGDHNADLLDGGAGTDTATYAGGGGTATIRLDLGFAIDPAGFTDTFVSIENIIGTPYSDIIAGKPGAANVLNGGAGNDVIYGEGIDTIFGGAGNDTFFGGQGGALNLNLATAGLETVWGSVGKDIIDGSTATAALTLVGQGPGGDTLKGGSADDFIYFRTGDTVSGGAGYDWAVAALSPTGVSLDIKATGFEVFWGSTSNDTATAAGATSTVVLVGDKGNDTLTGGNAGDFLYGFAGNDRLAGGPGNDNLMGDFASSDHGTDTFLFNSPNWGTDQIWDFTPGEDKIDMTGSGIADFDDLQLSVISTDFGDSMLITAGSSHILLVGTDGVAASDFVFG